MWGGDVEAVGGGVMLRLWGGGGEVEAVWGVTLRLCVGGGDVEAVGGGDSARDNVRSSDNFRLIMPRDQSYTYTCGKNVWTKAWCSCL